MEKVCILMSTYNGEKYVGEQLDSLLNQKRIDVRIIIRDDGSTDKTVEILRNYEKRFENIKIMQGQNIGYELSFLSLLKCAENYKYYAFSDQDDIWDDDKLITAITYIKSKEVIDRENNGQGNPIVYWCNLRLVDSKLKYLGDMKVPSETDFKKGRYLIDKYGYGCTMVFTKALKDLAIRYEPKHKISHDNWVGLLGVFLGEYVFDSHTHISYRQHDNNVVGGNNNFIGTWKRRIKKIKQIKQYSRAVVSQELLNGYKDILSDEDIKMLSLVSNYKHSIYNKIALIRSKELRRASKEKDILFKIMILISLA